MLGSRFDLAETIVEIAQRDAAEQDTDAAQEAFFGGPCAELERQMQEMAQRLHGAHLRTSFRCPICDDLMHLSSGQLVSEFAALGIEQHGLECDTCGLTTERVYHAAHGYQEIMR